MSAITTHVLDIASGQPGRGMRVTLERMDQGLWTLAGDGVTDEDGRLRTLLPAGQPAAPGAWRLTFETGAYFRARGIASYHPSVTVTFEVEGGGGHHHVPLLVSPFGYTTYRGT